jgi:hypothetical protein
MITSFIDGRVRIRDSGLQKGPVADTLATTLSAVAGIGEVRANRRVGSLLIIYDPSLITIDRIMEILAPVLEEKAPARKAALAGSVPAAAPRRVARPAIGKRKTVKIGMLVSLAASLVSAALDLKKLHIALGVVFLALLGGGHLYEKRRLLFI